jgi:orotate phosphoribosyltransferase
MRSIDKLIDRAEQLTDNGLTQGEVADELNVSRETASWLVSQRSQETTEVESTDSPIDVHVDWSAIGRDGHRLTHLGAIMGDLLAQEGADAGLTVGIGKTGAPLATVISQELDTDLSVYIPSKYQWDDDESREGTGSFSQNFATIAERDCYIVDDNIDTGQTMTEAITRVREAGGNPRAAVVLTDKLGQNEIEGVPVRSLIKMVQMGEH